MPRQCQQSLDIIYRGQCPDSVSSHWTLYNRGQCPDSVDSRWTLYTEVNAQIMLALAGHYIQSSMPRQCQQSRDITANCQNCMFENLST